jgi:hypothetical protein
MIGYLPLAKAAMGGQPSRLAPPNFSHQSRHPTCFFTQIGKVALEWDRKVDLCEKTGAGEPERALLLRLAPPGTMDPVLGDVHGEAERDPHIARRVAGSERVCGRQPELVQNHIAHEGAAEVLAELGGHGQGELGVLHRINNSEVTAMTTRLGVGANRVYVCHELVRQVVGCARHDVVEVGHRVERNRLVEIGVDRSAIEQ